MTQLLCVSTATTAGRLFWKDDDYFWNAGPYVEWTGKVTIFICLVNVAYISNGCSLVSATLNDIDVRLTFIILISFYRDS